jgi:hypothetical protein
LSAFLIAAVGIVYAAIAVGAAFKGNWPIAIVFGGYALSNVGLYKLA